LIKLSELGKEAKLLVGVGGTCGPFAANPYLIYSAVS